jgi:hypothetical protein
MPIPNPSIAFALFEDLAQAQAALQKLYEAGFSPDQVELTAKSDAAPAGREEGPAVLSPIRTLLIGGNRAAAQLYERLVDLGIAEDEAGYYRDQVDNGKLLATVISMRRERDAADLLRQFGGQGAFDIQLEASTMPGSQPGLIREDVAGPHDITTLEGP